MFKGILYLWKDECVFKMGHLCRRNVKLFLNLELSRLRKACIFVLYVFWHLVPEKNKNKLVNMLISRETRAARFFLDLSG